MYTIYIPLTLALTIFDRMIIRIIANTPLNMWYIVCPQPLKCRLGHRPRSISDHHLLKMREKYGLQ